MRRRTAEDRYLYNVRKQRRVLEEFADSEMEWADNLMTLYRIRNRDMPDDEYRACAFFKNREYLLKPGSLTLLYRMFLRCTEEMPEVTKELAFDLLAYRFKVYAKTLETGGF